MNIVNIIILFIFGTVFWSFGWVLISRNRDKKWIKSILFGRSKCDNCWKTLSALELVPIISFLVQKWKCKKCGKKLSNFYWILELVMWIIFVLTYLLFPFWNICELIARLLINWWLVLLIIVDYTKYELHLPMWIITTLICLIFSILNQPIKEIAITTGVFVLIFLWIYFLSKYYVKLKYKKNWEWFGQWDIYIAATVWILFPFVFAFNNIQFDAFNTVSLMLMYLIISCILWLIYAFVRNKIFKKSKEIPFIPSMIFSFWILLFLWKYFTIFMIN